MTAHDFDFIHGTWTIHNRKLRDNTDPTCDEWIEFEARGEAVPILAGSGNIDQMWVDDSPQGSFTGFTLRLWSPTEQSWSIWWSSTNAPGVLDEPVVGVFRDGRGQFECVQQIGGEYVVVRFEWIADPAAPQWNQYFSRDLGATWQHNWVMDFRRA